MDGTSATGQLTALALRPRGELRLAIESRADDAALRQLLRENPMAGDVRISLEREPSYFAAAALEGHEHRTIIAREGDRVVCAGGVSTRDRFVNGAPTRVGYLGGLRLDHAYRGRVSVIRRGFEMFRQLHEQSGIPIYFTSIMEENLPARRLLERGLEGMPTYHFLGEFITLVVRPPRRAAPPDASIVEGSDALLPQVCDLLNREQAKYQFSPIWTPEDLRSSDRCPNLQAQDFRLAVAQDSGPCACAAIWDQRSVRQAVVHGYSPLLARCRPAINLAATVLGRPHLPAVGQALAGAFVSHLASESSRPEITKSLLRQLCGAARARGVVYLFVGLDARDPRLEHLRSDFRPREYVSRIYAVYWEDVGEAFARDLDDRLLAPELAIL
jgi:hypothetical protein